MAGVVTYHAHWSHDYGDDLSSTQHDLPSTPHGYGDDSNLAALEEICDESLVDLLFIHVISQNQLLYNTS